MNTECKCNPGFHGRNCEKIRCPQDPDNGVECSGHGLCTAHNGLCNCYAGYTGENCAAPFALLTGLNTSILRSIAFNNETIDSYASQVGAMESAQLLNETSDIRRENNNLSNSFLNISTTFSKDRGEVNSTKYLLNDRNLRKKASSEIENNSKRVISLKFTNVDSIESNQPASKMRFGGLRSTLLKAQRAQRSKVDTRRFVGKSRE